jgi:hypothetical protein
VQQARLAVHPQWSAGLQTGFARANQSEPAIKPEAAG